MGGFLGDLWMWLQFMWLQLEVVLGPLGAGCGRFGAGSGPKEPQPALNRQPDFGQPEIAATWVIATSINSHLMGELSMGNPLDGIFFAHWEIPWMDSLSGTLGATLATPTKHFVFYQVFNMSETVVKLTEGSCLWLPFGSVAAYWCDAACKLPVAWSCRCQ